MKSIRIKSICLLMLSLLALAGCGGGNSPNSTNNTGNASANIDGVGSVTLLITDGPTELFDHIYLTITGVILISDTHGQVRLFDGEERVDLLSLRNFSEVFTTIESVPSGTYSKIRLLISDIELVIDDEQGEVADVYHPQIPANGKIDLNPRGDFTVADGGNTVITIDIDAEKSIKIHKTGRGHHPDQQEYKFRPVVFVQIQSPQQMEQGRLIKLGGEISDIDLDANTFQLCTLEEAEPVCYAVKLNDSTSLFDTTPMLIDLDSIEDGAGAMVTGWASDQEALDMQMSIDAVVVEVGDAGSFAFLSGTASADFDTETNSFAFTIEDGQGFESTTEIVVQLIEGTQLYDQYGEVVNPEDIHDGAELNVSGIISLAEADLINATLIFVNVDNGSNKYTGSIFDMNQESGIFNLTQTPDSLCIVSSSELSVFVVTDDESEEIDFSMLENGLTVDIYGTALESGCISAETIITFPEDEDEEEENESEDS